MAFERESREAWARASAAPSIVVLCFGLALTGALGACAVDDRELSNEGDAGSGGAGGSGESATSNLTSSSNSGGASATSTDAGGTENASTSTDGAISDVSSDSGGASSTSATTTDGTSTDGAISDTSSGGAASTSTTSTSTNNTSNATSTTATTTAGTSNCDDPLLIDDFEDLSTLMCPSDGRSGVWFVFNDGTVGGTQTPSTGILFEEISEQALPDSTHAGYSYGAGFTNWGAGIGARFVPDGPDVSVPYDASDTSGISFWAKSLGGFNLSLYTLDTQFAEYGGLCAADCDPHQIHFEGTGDVWTFFQVQYRDLAQLVPTIEFDARTLMQLNFVTDADAPFDFLIDDVRFVDGRYACDNDQGLIDDFELLTPITCETNGRGGTNWFNFGDNSGGAMYPAIGDPVVSDSIDPGPSALSTRTLYVEGTGFLLWGAGIGCEFSLRTTSEPVAYDASAYSGISFWVDSLTDLRLEVYSMSERYPGGIDCAEACMPHIIDIPATLGWELVEVPWAALSNGMGNTLDTSDLVQMNFLFGPDTEFSAYFDDVRFTP